MYAAWPVWSPDGGRIAFAGGGADAERELVRIWPDGTGRRTVLAGEHPSLAWSPDGEWIAFVDGLNTTDLWIAPAGGGPARQLTKGHDR